MYTRVDVFSLNSGGYVLRCNLCYIDVKSPQIRADMMSPLGQAVLKYPQPLCQRRWVSTNKSWVILPRGNSQPPTTNPPWIINTQRCITHTWTNSSSLMLGQQTPPFSYGPGPSRQGAKTELVNLINSNVSVGAMATWREERAGRMSVPPRPVDPSHAASCQPRGLSSCPK